MGQNNRAPLGLASTTSRALPQENGEGFSFLSPCPSKVKTTQGASGDTLYPKWPLIELHHDRVAVEFVEVGHE